MNAQELIAHYDSVLAADEWILWNPVAWTIIEPMGENHSVEYIGDLVSGVHDFHLEEVCLKEAMEVDEEGPQIYLDFFEGGYFFFDTYDLVGTQERLVRILGKNSFIWGMRWEAGAVQRRFFYACNGKIMLRMTDVLREPELEDATPLAEGITAVRSAWQTSPGANRDSALLALISLTSGALLTSDWLNGNQNAFVTKT
ncbi:hypothetical protein [Microbispora hainanensis]|uniref:Uncharacterized protein n=1 Tax=Microbispora hainanensis TaxID=568844 RepID=A0A544XR43_9ACTN|nr:hypothetical protein [Microbispora hainanensis]TQS06948.1 hypothetical protein FLX08_39515 [Microbispora hainanensis]